VFERHKEKRAEKAHEEAIAQWQARRDAYAALIQLASTYAGETSADLVLAPGEALFYRVDGASLVEERSTGGHYQGGSTGISVPIGSVGGRTVRYRVGANRGHYVQGTPTPTAVDTGTVFVTDRRIVFEGARQTRQCDFAKLIGFRHDDQHGSTTVSVSNRQKPVTVHYGPELSGAFDFRLDLALAHYRGTVDELVGQLRADLATIDGERPPAGVGTP